LASYRSGAEGKDYTGKNIKTGKVKKISKLELPANSNAIPE